MCISDEEREKKVKIVSYCFFAYKRFQKSTLKKGEGRERLEGCYDIGEDCWESWDMTKKTSQAEAFRSLLFDFYMQFLPVVV